MRVESVVQVMCGFQGERQASFNRATYEMQDVVYSFVESKS